MERNRRHWPIDNELGEQHERWVKTQTDWDCPPWICNINQSINQSISLCFYFVVELLLRKNHRRTVKNRTDLVAKLTTVVQARHCDPLNFHHIRLLAVSAVVKATSPVPAFRPMSNVRRIWHWHITDSGRMAGGVGGVRHEMNINIDIQSENSNPRQLINFLSV